MPKKGRKTWIEVGGERLCAEMVAERCRVPVGTARSRVMLYKRGQIDLLTLLHVGPKRSTSRTRRKASEPTEEWRQMDKRPAREPRFQPGTWERKHLAGLGKGRTMGNGLVDARTVEHAAYSGQYRINI